MSERTNGMTRGVEVRGMEPKDLLLSDGTRLCLETEAEDRGRVMWRRDEGEASDDGAISVSDAIDLAGDEYTSYIVVRTRAEIEWLRATAEWFADQANGLSDELKTAGPASARAA